MLKCTSITLSRGSSVWSMYTIDYIKMYCYILTHYIKAVVILLGTFMFDKTINVYWMPKETTDVII